MGTTAMGFHSEGERWVSISNSVKWVKNYQEKTAGVRAVLAKPT